MREMWNDGAPFENWLASDEAPAIARRHVCSFGGKGSSGGTQTQTSNSTVSLPPWVDAQAQANLAQASAVSQNLMGPYTGQRVAGQTSGQQADIAALQNNVGSTNPAFAVAQDTAAGLTGFQPGQVNAGTLAGTDLSAYMNPYTNSVIGSGLQALDLQRRQALNQVGDQAITSHAFGGSRQGVAEGVTNAGSAMQAGNLASQLMAQNFSQAQGAATNDLNRNLTAQQANQQAGIQGAGVNLNAANALGTLAGQGQNAFLTGTSAALAGQESTQQNQQAQLTAQQQAYQEAQNFPVQQLQILQSALGQTPYGQTTNTTATGPGPSSNGLMQGLGAVGTGVGILGGLNSLAGSGGISGLLAMSDRSMKTDIKKLGKDKESGLDLYAYRYKGDPKSYPKIVGPMAQDIEKKYPDQVVTVAGRKAVNLGFGPMAAAFHG